MQPFRIVAGAEAETDRLQIYRRVYDASRDPNVAGRFLDRLISRPPSSPIGPKPTA